MSTSEIDQLQMELAELRAKQPKRTTPHLAFEHLLQRMYAEVEEIREMLTPEITLQIPPATPPDVIVNVPSAEVRVDVPAAEVRVDVPDQSAAVNALASVLAELVGLYRASLAREMDEGEKVVTFNRDQQGRIMSATVTEA